MKMKRKFFAVVIIGTALLSGYANAEQPDKKRSGKNVPLLTKLGYGEAKAKVTELDQAKDSGKHQVSGKRDGKAGHKKHKAGDKHHGKAGHKKHAGKRDAKQHDKHYGKKDGEGKAQYDWYGNKMGKHQKAKHHKAKHHKGMSSKKFKEMKLEHKEKYRKEWKEKVKDYQSDK